MMGQWMLPCVYAFLASVGYGLKFEIRSKNLWYAAAGGMLGWFVYLLFGGIFANDVMQYFIAALAISFYSEVIAIIRKAPVTVFLVVSIIPLVPGGTIFYTMESFLSGNNHQFWELGVYTFKVAGAIAMGIFSSSSVIRFIRYNRIGRGKNKNI
jgi:uncharacterized membrane protein YjjB (DUF3815 family)